MKTADGVAPALGEEGPEKDGAAGKDEGRGAFGEGGKAQKETEQDGGKGG